MFGGKLCPVYHEFCPQGTCLSYCRKKYKSYRISRSADATDKGCNFTGGVGGKLTPDLLVGVFTGYENFNFTMDSIAGKMTGNGGLTGSYRYAAVILEPSARIYALWEREGDWTDSLGAVQAARNFSVGRVSAGGKAIYPWEIASGTRIAPYVGFYGDYRFASDSALPVSVSNAGIKNGSSGRVTTGVTTTMTSGLALSVGGELGGLGAGYEIWSMNVRAALPF